MTPAQAEVTVLHIPVIGRDRDDAASIAEKLRGRTAAAFTRRHHVGTTGDHIGRYRLLAESRNHAWMTEDNQKETLEFLAANRLPYVCVDMPQGHRSLAEQLVWRRFACCLAACGR